MDFSQRPELFRGANRPMAIQKVFVRQDKTAVIKYPHCSFTQTGTIDRNFIKKYILTVRCKCGQALKAELESRRHFRKATTIPAYDRNLTKEKELEQEQGYSTIARYGSDESKPAPDCVINNISVRGIGFEVKGHRRFDKGDIVQIELVLDNVAQTEIIQKVVVRNISGNRIGSEFSEDSQYQVTLSFYLNG